MCNKIITSAGNSTALGPALRGLPPSWCVSQAVWELEVERIWLREWHCIGRADQVPSPGDYLCVDHVGEPLVMIRGDDGVLRVLSRVCRHRAMPVLQGAGNTAAVVCPYHAWSYHLDGRLRRAPEMHATPDFDPESCRLPEIRSEVWEGFVFINFAADAAPLGPALAGLSRAIDNYRLADMRTVRRLPFDELCDWNWKLECDNYIEAYHHIGAHRHSLEPLMPGRDAYELPSDGPWSAVRMPYRDGASPFDGGRHRGCGMPAIDTLTPEERDSLTVVHVFPGTKITLWGGHMDFYRMFPCGPLGFRSEKDYCMPPAMLSRDDLDDVVQWLVDGFLEFRHEDDDLCRLVQRSFASRFASPAPLSHLEGAVARFARWVEARIGDPASIRP
ncbi:MAG: aromatic ring-hydroxylating dioxygenase subunit alpha [Gammaproteobacteria bacterium]|nr:aromatic ring-hydroxylating dioxygenase subunit alpha [Gammaproteobacteria bacterium]